MSPDDCSQDYRLLGRNCCTEAISFNPTARAAVSLLCMLTNMVRRIALLLFLSTAFAADFGKTTTTKVAEGVYLFTTTGHGDVGLSGNSVAIITDEGVVVFDTAGLPTVGEHLIAELRKVTDKPLRYVINSHWHWDHWGGNQAFKAAYPNVQFIAQAKTRDLMRVDSIAWNKDYVGKAIPGHIADLEKRLADAKAQNAPTERIASINALLEADKDFLKQKTTLTNTFPETLFSESLTLHLGGREIQIHAARAITPGDAYVFLPKERILITGDALLHPIVYAIGGVYPTTWIATLKKFVAHDPAIVIPGHGPVEMNQDFLKANLKLFERVLADVQAAKAKRVTQAQIQEELGKNALEYAALIGVESARVEEFKGLFLNNFTAAAYEELDGPLGDKPKR
jgi:cyclase